MFKNSIYQTPEELKAKIEKDKQSGRVIRCYADGIFDLFHYGHARVLEQCKKAFPNTYLLVGCCDDESTHRLKGKTVLTDEERYESLRHCKWVDEVIRGSPWVVTPEFIEKYNIDYVCHDSLPYATDGCDDIYENIRRMGKFYETQRTEGISTSDIIVRIIKDYDGFVRRNLSRGISAKEMNVPYVKEKTIQISSTLENGTKKIEETIKKGVFLFIQIFTILIVAWN